MSSLQVAAMTFLSLAVVGAGLYVLNLSSRYWTQRNQPQIRQELARRYRLPIVIMSFGAFGLLLVGHPPSNLWWILQLIVAVALGGSLERLLRKSMISAAGSQYER